MVADQLVVERDFLAPLVHASMHCRAVDGAWPLGHDDETRGLPESGDDDCVAQAARHDVPVSWGCEEVTEQ